MRSDNKEKEKYIISENQLDLFEQQGEKVVSGDQLSIFDREESHIKQ